MKKIIIVLTAILFTTTINAQTGKKVGLVKDSFAVNGNCGMCKKTIESAAKKAGASTALWNEKTKQLLVTYTINKTSNNKIQKAIAKVGYDNQGAKATDAAYDKLHGCCKYEREKETTTN